MYTFGIILMLSHHLEMIFAVGYKLGGEIVATLLHKNLNIIQCNSNFFDGFKHDTVQRSFRSLDDFKGELTNRPVRKLENTPMVVQRCYNFHP